MRVFHWGFKHEKTDESMRSQAECFYCFRVFETLMKHEARVFEITSPTKKISLNYHLNKVSQFNYYIWDVKCAWCAWSYHLTAALWQFLNIHQLTSRCYPACLSVLSEHVASQNKSQSADLDLLKLAKKRKIVWTALFLGQVCIWSDIISNVSAILGRKSTARL